MAPSTVCGHARVMVQETTTLAQLMPLLTALQAGGVTSVDTKLPQNLGSKGRRRRRLCVDRRQQAARAVKQYVQLSAVA